jgi:Zn-dependent peptidase ImmA (M78 family)
MLSVKNVRDFATANFPEAPEKLAEHLGIDVRRSPMAGCDGWCLALGSRAIVRINSLLSPRRQRFTLAHELGHLVLGVPTIVGESLEDMLGSDSDEERRVNDLAAELLIPTQVVKAALPELPIVATALKRLARQANVSELAAAIRVANVAEQIGLLNASVVLFDGANVRWQWSRTLRMSNATATFLLQKSRKTTPHAFRQEQQDGNVAVASIIENPYFGSATLFVQLLPPELGLKVSRHERRGTLERVLFADDKKLQQRMSGFFGFLKTRIAGKTKQEVEADFWSRYQEKLRDTPISSREGHEYVRLRIAEWF